MAYTHAATVFMDSPPGALSVTVTAAWHGYQFVLGDPMPSGTYAMKVELYNFGAGSEGDGVHTYSFSLAPAYTGEGDDGGHVSVTPGDELVLTSGFDWSITNTGSGVGLTWRIPLIGTAEDATLTVDAGGTGTGGGSNGPAFLQPFTTTVLVYVDDGGLVGEGGAYANVYAEMSSVGDAQFWTNYVAVTEVVAP